MKVVLVLDVESTNGDVIERDKGAIMVALRNLLLDDFEHDEYLITSVPEFYT